MKTKEELRRKGLKQRSQISKKDIEEKSRKIQEKVLRFLGKNDTVMIYVSYKKEVKTDRLIEELLQKRQFLAVPKVSGDKMIASRIESMGDLTENSQSIREPEDVNKISNNSIDQCIIPGVRFDRYGNRIGYGRGYYDRFLENFKGQK